MGVMEKLPWYGEYTNILAEKPDVEREILNFEDTEKQLEKVERFYEMIGADYSRNRWLSRLEADITAYNKGEDGSFSQLKKKAEFASVLEMAVEYQDDDGIRALALYRDDRLYGKLARQVMFFIGVTKAKREREFIRKAYDAIYRAYPVSQTDLFNREGVYYYLYYFQCLQECITYFKGGLSYKRVCLEIKDRCYSARLMLSPYRLDLNVFDKVRQILDEIDEVEDML